MRKIVVGGRVFFWKFHGRWQKQPPRFISQLSALLAEDRSVKIIVRFRSHDTFTAGNPLKEGLPMLKDGAPVIVNLNQPRFMAEIITFLGQRDPNLLQGRNRCTLIENGKALLEAMGYREEPAIYLLDT